MNKDHYRKLKDIRIEDEDIRPEDISKFWSLVNKELVNKETGMSCWLWMGGLRNYVDHSWPQYGHFWVRSKRYMAHRFSYLLEYKIIPASHPLILHECDFHPCVFPGHLTAGTHKQNMMDMIRKGHNRNRFSPPRNWGWVPPVLT